MTSVVSPALRARVRTAAEPIARGFGRVGLTPNMLTLIGFGISVIGAAFASRQDWFIAGVIVGVGAVFDLFDGALARATGRTSRLGAFLDSTFDRAGEVVVYLAIAWATAAEFQPVAVLATTAMASSFMVSYVRAKSESLGFTPGTGMANIGLAPREVRLSILVVGLLGTGLGGGLNANPWLPIALGAITVLATITTIQRIYHVYQQAKKENHG